jgi:hypothetical protein
MGWIARPDLTGDLEEIMSGMSVVPGDGANALAARSDTTSAWVNTALVEDLAQTIGIIDFTTVGIELGKVLIRWTAT